MKRSLMLTAAAMLLAGGAANADKLKGTWSFVGNDNCVMGGPFPNNDSGSPAQSTNFVVNGGVQGFAIFNGDGTGTITIGGSWVQARYIANIIPGIGGYTAVDHFSAYTYSATIAFTYTVTGDEFTLTETSNTGTLSGLGAFTVTGVPTFNGTISENRPPVLQTATGTPAQETWTFGPIGLGPLAALCVRTRTLTKVKD